MRENGGEEILKATTLKQMQRVHWIGADFDEPAWGLAYGSRRYGDKTLWGHGGYCPGTRTEFVMRLPTKVGVVMMLTANDVSPGAMVESVYSLTENSIAAVYAESADDEEAEDTSDDGVMLSEYEGLYLVENYPNDLYVGVSPDGLFAVSLLSSDPVSGMEEWVHEEGDRFRRKREDDTLAESIDFERDEDGQIKSLMHHGYRSTKKQP